MTRTGDLSHSPTASASHYAPTTGRSTLMQLGGGLGLAGCCIGLLVFLGACFGFSAALHLTPLPLAMGAVGIVLTIVAGLRDPHIEGPSVAAGIFINLAALAGGVLLLCAWLSWRIFP